MSFERYEEGGDDEREFADSCTTGCFKVVGGIVLVTVIILVLIQMFY